MTKRQDILNQKLTSLCAPLSVKGKVLVYPIIMLRRSQFQNFANVYLSRYFAELFPILRLWWCLPELFTLLKCSQLWNIADVNPVLLLCWDVPNLKIVLTNTLSHYNSLIVFKLKTVLRNILTYYNAELFSILRHCGWTPWLFTLLRSSESWNIADIYPVSLSR